MSSLPEDIDLTPPPEPIPPSNTEITFKIPRPKNSWILFRHDLTKNWPPTWPRLSQSLMSKFCKQIWEEQTPEERSVWERKAEEEKEKHRQKYPDYKYKPVKKEDKLRQIEEKKAAAAEKKAAGKRAVSGKGAPAPSVGSHSARVTPYPTANVHGSYPTKYGPNGPSPAWSDLTNDSASASGSGSALPTPPTEPASPATFDGNNMSASVPSIPYNFHTLAPNFADPQAFLPPVITGGAVPQTFFPPVAANGEVPPNASEVENGSVQAWDGSLELPTTSNEGFAYEQGQVTPAELHLSSQLSLEMNQQGYNDLSQWWNAENGANSFENELALLNNESNLNDDLLAVEFLQFDDELAASYPADMEVNVGQLPIVNDPVSYLSPDTFANIDFLGPYHQNFTSASNELGFPAYNGNLESFETPLPDLSGFLNSGDPMVNDILQPVENAVTSSSSSQPYVPPAGASNSGNRRVAATYKKPQVPIVDETSHAQQYYYPT